MTATRIAETRVYLKQPGRAAGGQTPSDIAVRINHRKWRTKTWIAHRSGI